MRLVISLLLLLGGAVLLVSGLASAPNTTTPTQPRVVQETTTTQPLTPMSAPSDRQPIRMSGMERTFGAMELSHASPRVTVTTPEIEYANPVELALPVLGVKAPIDQTGFAFDSDRFDPAAGHLDWWLDSEVVGPCETGAVLVLGHMPIGEPFRNLVRAEEYGNQNAMEVGDTAVFQLVDGTRCVYQVFDLRKQKDAPGQPLADSPGKFFLKDDFGKGVDDALIKIAEGRAIAYLLTSYKGPGTESAPYCLEEGHRCYNAVVAAELVEVVPPEEGS